METNAPQFRQFIPNIESIPFSDVEACNILNITNTQLNRALKLGMVQKSVEIHYRFDISFNFISLFDIYEYALRSNLFFLNYGPHHEVSELVYGLVDEMAFLIDNCLCSSPAPKMSRIKKDFEALCRDDFENRREYWLYEGEPFSTDVCATIALQTWCDVFEKTMSLISPLEEYLGIPVGHSHISNDKMVWSQSMHN